MAKIKLKGLLTKGRSLLLALDQGLEHGPKDFTAESIDPAKIFAIAEAGRYSGIIVQKGLAEKYGPNFKVPLVIKLNGKSAIPRIDPYAAPNCSVRRAAKLGAVAVGYTIYLGSPAEPIIFKEFGQIQEAAHEHGLPVIAWMYPRGPFIADELHTDILAYAARAGLELGADVLKLKYNNDPEGFKWVVACAGAAKVLVAGGEKVEPAKFLQQVREVLEAGAAGMAVGRNVWQSDRPLKLTAALRTLIFENKPIEEALKALD